MKLLSLRVLSRYPEALVDGSLYKRLTQITALRFSLSGIIKPSAVRIKLNSLVIHQEDICDDQQPISKINDTKFFNIWLNLQKSNAQINKLTIELKICGIYIPLKSYQFIFGPTNCDEVFSLSDAFIQPNLLSEPNATGTELVNEIIKLPCNIRSTKTDLNNIKIRSILLLRLDQLGDFVMTASAVQELKFNFPEAKLTMLVSPANEPIAHSTKLFDEVHAIPFSFEHNTNFRSLSKEAKNLVSNLLSDKHYDIAVDLSPMPETRELLGLVSADKKFGFENTNTSMIDVGILMHAKDPINYLSNVSHATYPLVLADTIKRIIKPQISHLPKKDPNAEILKKLKLTANDYIVIHSGARNVLVRWPIEKFLELAKLLAEQNYNLVFFSDEVLELDKKSILEQYNSIVILDYRLDFDDFDTILSNSAMFIGNDSGPKHLAAMRMVPVISIHSPRTNWSEWGQIDSGYVISNRYPCAGCAIITENECGRSLKCIKNIGVNEILNVFKRLEAELLQCQ